MKAIIHKEITLPKSCSECPKQVRWVLDCHQGSMQLERHPQCPIVSTPSNEEVEKMIGAFGIFGRFEDVVLSDIGLTVKEWEQFDELKETIKQALTHQSTVSEEDVCKALSEYLGEEVVYSRLSYFGSRKKINLLIQMN